MQKKKIFILTFVLLFSLVYADNDFTDTNNHWAEKYIKDLSSMGLIKGYSDHTFKPDNKILNVEVYSIINNLIQEKDLADIQVRKDYKSKWYFEELQKAKAAGYADINEDFEVKPITRVEMIEIISKIYNLSKGEDEDDYDDEILSDCDNLSLSDRRTISDLIRNKVVSGYENGTFRPEGKLTRAEFSKIVSVSNKKMKINSRFDGKIVVDNMIKIGNSRKELENLVNSVSNISSDEHSDSEIIRISSSVEKAKDILREEYSNLDEINQSISDINDAIKDSSLESLVFKVTDEDGDEIEDCEIFVNYAKFKNGSKVKPGKYFAKITADKMIDSETYVIVGNEDKTVEITMEKQKGSLHLNLGEGLSSDKDSYFQNEIATIHIDIPEGKEVKKMIVDGKEKKVPDGREETFRFLVTGDNMDVEAVFG